MSAVRFMGVGLISCSFLLVSGCQKYQAKPLVAADVLRTMEQARRYPDAPVSDAPSEKLPFTFGRAADLMKRHSPALRESWAEYETALALSKVKTPLPNPGIEVGPQYGFGPDVSSARRLQPFGAISFAIPTGQRLRRQDELNRMLAEQAQVEAFVRHRELYLELRQHYSRLAMGGDAHAKDTM